MTLRDNSQHSLIAGEEAPATSTPRKSSRKLASFPARRKLPRLHQSEHQIQSYHLLVSVAVVRAILFGQTALLLRRLRGRNPRGRKNCRRR